MKQWVGMVLGAAAISASGAGAQEITASEGPVITRPAWLKRPTADDIAAVFPEEARRRGVDGRGVISCRVTLEGTLERCQVVEETPRGSGYGFAALALAPQFLMRPQTVDGKPVSGANVRIPIVFQTGGPVESLRRAPSSTTPGAAMYLSRPIWTAAPTRAQVAAVYPAQLKSAGTVAQAQLDCALELSGTVSGCTAVAEQPSGKGAGRAALLLARSFRTDPPRNPDGSPVRRARVRFPVVFSPTVLNVGAEQIARPDWGRLPQASEVSTSFPAEAKAAKIKGGAATLDCRVQAGGGLKDCSVARETPAGMGFGRAALALAPSFRMSAWTSDGRPVDGARVRIPIRYEDEP